MADYHSGPVVLDHVIVSFLDPQLGGRHHIANLFDQAIVFPAFGGQLSLHGKDEIGCAQAGKNQETVCR